MKLWFITVPVCICDNRLFLKALGDNEWAATSKNTVVY